MVDPPAEPTAKEPSDMHKKREAFLKHLKQKYPHHASTIMNQQGQLRQQGEETPQTPAAPARCRTVVERSRDRGDAHSRTRSRGIHPEGKFFTVIPRARRPPTPSETSGNLSRTCQPPAGDPVGHTAASLDSLDAMSEGEVPPIPPAFNRGSRMRASLPVVRSTNQTRDRSLGTPASC
ncbi:sickle tail protein-like [Arapaima gigas]